MPNVIKTFYKGKHSYSCRKFQDYISTKSQKLFKKKNWLKKLSKDLKLTMSQKYGVKLNKTV